MDSSHKNDVERMNVEDCNIEKEVDEDDHNVYYDIEMIPKRNSSETKTGVTIKGDSSEYIEGHGKIKKMLDQKGANFLINGRGLRILDNAKNKPIKVEIKPLKGPSGKVNIKIYDINAKGRGTIMITKVSDGNLCHVKALAFKVVKYIIDGIIDGELTNEDLDNLKRNSETMKTENLECDKCEKSFKTKHGLSIHAAKLHGTVAPSKEKKSNTDFKCIHCNFTFSCEMTLKDHVFQCQMNLNCVPCKEIFQTEVAFNVHMKSKHEEIELVQSQIFKCDYCDIEIVAESNLQGLKEIKSHHEICKCKPKSFADPELKCWECDFCSISELKMKRHKRDNHGITTKSISPQPKRRKQQNIIHIEDMEIDSDDVLIQRSKMQDDKIRRKEKKQKEEEEKLIEKRKIELVEKKRKDIQLKENKKTEKARLKNKVRNIRKQEKEISRLKAYMREIPDNCRKLLGEGFVLYPVKGDGACGPRCAAA